MNKLTSRIKSSNVQLGESFILESYKKNMSLQEEIEEERRVQEQEFKKNLEEMLIEANNQAKAIIKDANVNAEEIARKAEQDALKKAEEIENLKQQQMESGYAEGFQKGYDEGILKGKQEILDNAWGLGVLASSAFSVKKEIINSAEREILDLSVAIAEKVLRSQLEVKPELLQGIIKAAIEQLKDKEEIKIIVNPVLTQNLYEVAEGFKETIKGLKSIKIIEDKTIPKDGVIVESPESRIDARIETQLRELVRNLMQEFSQKSNSEGIPKEIDVRIEDKLSEQDES